MNNQNIIVTGVGGQGVVTLGLLLSRSAISSGANVIMSEIHGLAQRGGSVSVDVRIGNFMAPIIPTGDADLIVALEPLEALRSLDRAGRNTKVIVNTERMPPVSLGIHRQSYPDIDSITDEISRHARLYPVDASSLAKDAGNYKAVNTVILGFLSGLNLLKTDPEVIMREIDATFSGKFPQVNRRAFDLGKEAAAETLAALKS